jgi:hypothetical protein
MYEDLSLDGRIDHNDRHRRSLHKVPADLSKFWVITVISNSQRYKRRYELYWKFAEMCEHAGVNLITVEEAFGDRQFMVTDPNNKYHLQVRSVEELWKKENFINLGVRHACTIAPGQVREVAWVDADCRPTRTPRDWFDETWHKLQHYEFVQMWEYLIDLDYNFNPIGGAQPGFMANYIKYGTPNPIEFRKLEAEHQAKQKMMASQYPGTPSKGERMSSSTMFGRPGLAWAANLNAFNAVGGLIDFSILGAGDWYMAHGLLGTLETARSEYAYGPYMRKLLQWQDRALRWIKKDVGYVSGTVYHDFHGRKALRFYGSRGKILRDNKYDPEIDIKYDAQGVLQLETWDDRQIKLRDQIRGYMAMRNEDSIDL